MLQDVTDRLVVKRITALTEFLSNTFDTPKQPVNYVVPICYKYYEPTVYDLLRLARVLHEIIATTGTCADCASEQHGTAKKA